MQSIIYEQEHMNQLQEHQLQREEHEPQEAMQQVSISKGFLPSYIKRKILPHFADLNNLPKSMDNPLWQEIQTVCGLTLAEIVKVMNARCQAAPVKCEAPAVAIKKQKKIPALHFTNLHFDIIITICEILDIDTLLSLYLALKKYVPLNPRNTTSAIEGLTWVINKKMNAISAVQKNIKPILFEDPCWGVNAVTTRIIRNLANYDTTDLSNEILIRICYLSGQTPTIFIPYYVADHTINFSITGRKNYSKGLHRNFGIIRQNKVLADQLRVIMIRTVCKNLEKRLIPFYNKVLIDDFCSTPNCFAHPIHILQQIVAKMSQEQLVPFARHVHTDLQADIKTLKRIRVPEKVGVLAKKVELKQQANALVLAALEEGEVKKEIAAFYVKVESYAHMEALAIKKKAQADARNKAWREQAQAAQQARLAAQQAQALQAQQAHQIQMFQDYQLPPQPQQTIEEEQETADVTLFHHEGRDYLKGVDSGIMYDIETQEEIGIWDGTQIVQIV